MATIDVQPITLKNVLFTVGADDYAKHVSAVEFVPSTSTTTWKGLHPDAVFTDVAAATWTCNLSFAQDWETVDSLSAYLFDHEGDTVSVTFEPQAGGTGFSADLVITPGSIGGTVDSTAVSTVALGVQGRPVRLPAA